jgi:hypothetical protein
MCIFSACLKNQQAIILVETPKNENLKERAICKLFESSQILDVFNFSYFRHEWILIEQIKMAIKHWVELKPIFLVSYFVSLKNKPFHQMDKQRMRLIGPVDKCNTMPQNFLLAITLWP